MVRGVDWGSQTHQACVIDVAGKLLGERAFEHGGQGLSEMADWVVSFAAGAADQVGVAIETPRGPVVESLMERGLAVHAINPKQLDRFRDRLSPAGAKDDRRDARVLASALRTDPHCLRRLEPTDPAIVELREWSRISEELTRERTRQANRMREQLWRYYPQLLAATSDEVAAPWALDLWRRLPTPAAAQRVREATLAKLLQQHRIRRVDAATLRERLQAPVVKVAPGAAEAAAAHVRLLAERLVLINRQLGHARRQLGRLVRFPLGRRLRVLAPLELQAVGLLDVEHGVGAHQRRAALLARLPRLVARAVLARALLVVELVEQNVGALLTFTDLSAKLLDLLVGAPSVIGVPLCGLRHAQVERVPASVRPLAGDVRRELRLAGLPGFLPRRNPRLDLLADLAGKLLVVLVLAPLRRA